MKTLFVYTDEKFYDDEDGEVAEFVCEGLSRYYLTDDHAYWQIESEIDGIKSIVLIPTYRVKSIVVEETLEEPKVYLVDVGDMPPEQAAEYFANHLTIDETEKLYKEVVKYASER